MCNNKQLLLNDYPTSSQLVKGFDIQNVINCSLKTNEVSMWFSKYDFFTARYFSNSFSSIVMFIACKYIYKFCIVFLLHIVWSYAMHRFCFSKEISYNCLMLLTWKMHVLYIIFSQTNPFQDFTCITVQKNGLEKIIYSRLYLVVLFRNKNACVDLLWW